MDLSTTSYQQETPAWLWHAFKQGPADDYDRCNDRLTKLIAVDVLETAPELLDEDETLVASKLAAEVEFADVDV